VIESKQRSKFISTCVDIVPSSLITAE